jgi:energy-coupling factor transport system substrate-specific component
MASADQQHSTRPDAWRTWRTRDIVITAVIGVAFGVVFWAWGLAYNAILPFFPAVPWVVDIMYGMWFVPAVLAPLIVRKPGAALFAETVAAGLSMLLGTVWAADVLLSGVLQGLAAELVFLATAYRLFTFPVLALAALAASVPAFIHDWIIWYPTVDPTVQIARFVVMAISSVVIAAGGAVLLERQLRRTGVLDGFPD